MKKNAILFLGVLAGYGVSAQDAQTLTERPAEPTSVVENVLENNHSITLPNANGKEAVVIWSEDFANGIPSTWTNQGSSVNALWEYRGTATTPSNAVGSRGAYAGPNVAGGNQGAPIVSPTASNGFVIFDSDYLDNNGVRATPGGGVAPTPHKGNLITPVIDLSSYNNVQLSLNSYIRYFAGRCLVAISIDGGLTWSDTVQVAQSLAVNAASTTNYKFSANISAEVGGESNVVLNFLYDGTYDDPSANGEGYYFWMLDDIELTEVPENELRFVNFQGAPPYDIIFDGGNSPKYGIMQTDQAVPVVFDGNILNYGVNAQTNVVYTVKILDGTGATVTTLSSPTLPTLASGDTGSFNVFTTSTSWTPTAAGDYFAVVSASSDSVGVAAGSIMPSDTIQIRVRDDQMAVDWNRVSNTVGSNSAASGEMINIGALYTLGTGFCANNTSMVGITEVVPYISSVTDPIAEIEVQIWDSTGFTYGAGGGFPVTSQPLFTQTYNLSGLVPATGGALIPFDVRGVNSNGDSIPLTLPAGDYYVVLSFIINTPNEVVRIGNDATWEQPAGTAIMGFDDGAWYGGFSNSRTLESPIIRLGLSSSCNGIGLEENTLEYVSAYPNPSTGKINLTLDKGGKYDFRLLNVTGQVVKSFSATVNAGEEIPADFSDVAKGTYLLNVNGEDFATTLKISLK